MVFSSNYDSNNSEGLFNFYVMCGEKRFAIYYGEEPISYVNEIGDNFNVFRSGLVSEDELLGSLESFVGGIIEMPKKGVYKCN